MFAFLPQKIPFSLHQSSALGLCSFSSAKDSIFLTPITYFRSMLSFPRKSFLFDTVRTVSAKCFAFVGCTAFAVCCTTKKGFLVSKLPPCCIRNPLPPCCIRRPSVLLMHGFRRMLYHEKRFLGKQASPMLHSQSASPMLHSQTFGLAHARLSPYVVPRKKVSW